MAASSPVPRYALKAGDRWSSHGRILEILGPAAGRTLLDVGCAHGSVAALLRDAGFAVTCVERDAHAAGQARALGLTVVQADAAEDLPFERGRFDVLLLADVLEHLVQPEDALPRLLRLLAPRGLVVISVPNVAHLWIRLNLLMGRFEYQDRGILDRTHLRFFTRRSFLRLLDDAGLAVERLLTTPAPLPLVVPERLHGGWLRALQRVQAWAAAAWRGPFAYQFVASCRRREER